VAHTPAGDVVLTGRVVDNAGILPKEAEAVLSRRLADLERKTTDQLVVVSLPSLGKAKIEEVGLALGRGWGIGRADYDNGVLLIVAPTERRVRIEVGYGLEGLLTDQKAAAIIGDIVPIFRSGRYPEAIEAGVSGIEGILQSDRVRPRYKEEKKAA
jgi:uncharacterized protein